MKKPLLLATLLPLPLHAALIECWPFNDVPAGAINGNGSVVSLGINGMPAVILGGGASSFGNMIDLPGGGSATQAYIDLPNGIISSNTNLTAETWMSINSLQAWQRVFDFGSTDTGVGAQGGELFGPGGGGQGLEYILLAPNQGTNPAAQRLEHRENGGTTNTTDSFLNIGAIIGQQHLFTFTWEDLGGGFARQSWYLDGTLAVQSGAFAASLTTLNDVNNWLGRSNWVNDANTDGTYDQFALYDHAMTGAEALASFNAGPVGHIPEPSVNLILAGSLLGLMARRRRA